MELLEFIVEAVNKNEGIKLAYVSKNVGKIQSLHNTLIERTDATNSNTKVLGIHPIGIGNLPENIDIVLYEAEETSEEHILKHVKFSTKFRIYEVKENNLGLVYAEDRTGQV